MFHECEARYPAARSAAGLESDGYVWTRHGAITRLLTLLGFTDV